jgi:tetratricopeptide (TPR) repeat protein
MKFVRVLLFASLPALAAPSLARGADPNHLGQMQVVNRYLAQGQPDAAARVLESLLAQHPDDAVASVAYADVLIKLQRYDDADAFLERALARVEEKGDLYRMREALRRAQGRPEDAFADLVRVLEAAGKDRALWAYQEAGALLDAGLPRERARKLAEEARSQHPDAVEFLILDGAVETLTGHGDEALRRIVARDRAEKHGGEDVLKYAEAVRSLGLEDPALKGLEQAAALSEKPIRRSEILLQAVDIQEHRGDYQDALAGLERIAADRAGTAAAANALLRSAQIRQEHLHDPQGALAVYEKIQDDPALGHHRPEMLAQMADAYLRLGRLEDAEKTYREVIPEAFDPDQAEHAAYALGDLELYRGNPDSAIVLYQDMAEKHPRSRYADQAAGRYILLNKLSQVGGGSEAARTWGKMEWARTVGDSAGVAEAALELVAASQGGAPAAIDELGAEALLALAEVASAGKNYTEALSRLGELVAEHPDDHRAPEALRREGDILYRDLGKPDEALARYESILTDYPLSVQAGDARRRVEALRRELKS